MSLAVAYDGSEVSARALERAISDAHAKEERLVVIVVAETSLRAPDAYIIHAVGDAAMKIAHLAEANAAMALYVGAHHHRWFDVLTGADTVQTIRHRVRCEVIVVE